MSNEHLGVFGCQNLKILKHQTRCEIYMDIIYILYYVWILCMDIMYGYVWIWDMYGYVWICMDINKIK